MVNKPSFGAGLIVLSSVPGSAPAKVEFSGKISGERKTWKCQANFPEQDTDNPELERLWALSMIDEELQEIRDKGETSDRRDKVVDFGTQYSLVTDYTSMVVL